MSFDTCDRCAKSMVDFLQRKDDHLCIVCVYGELVGERDKLLADKKKLTALVELDGNLRRSDALAYEALQEGIAALHAELARRTALHTQNVATLAQIEGVCTRHGYAPESGEPVADWLDERMKRLPELEAALAEEREHYTNLRQDHAQLRANHERLVAAARDVEHLLMLDGRHNSKPYEALRAELANEPQAHLERLRQQVAAATDKDLARVARIQVIDAPADPDQAELEHCHFAAVGFYEHIKHGDQEHRRWLRDKCLEVAPVAFQRARAEARADMKRRVLAVVREHADFEFAALSCDMREAIEALP